MSYKLTGTIKSISDTNVVSEKFSKREFVVTDNSGKYPQDILFQLTQDKCQLLDGMMTGSEVEVSFNLRGREWTSPQGEVKYFNTLEAWRIDVGSAPAPMSIQDPLAAVVVDNATEAEDDLPF